MKRSSLGIALLGVLASIAALAEVPASGGLAVAVFASEKIMGQWVESYFGALPTRAAEPNECEAVLTEVFRNAGFVLPAASFDDAQRLEARKVHTVFGRYGDVSAIPNDTAIRAAGAVMVDAQAAIACGVAAVPRKAKRTAPAAICASIGCKAVDAQTKRRVATASAQSCIPAADRATGSIAAIRAACRDAGSAMAQKLLERY